MLLLVLCQLCHALLEGCCYILLRIIALHNITHILQQHTAIHPVGQLPIAAQQVQPATSGKPLQLKRCTLRSVLGLLLCAVQDTNRTLLAQHLISFPAKQGDTGNVHAPTQHSLLLCIPRTSTCTSCTICRKGMRSSRVVSRVLWSHGFNLSAFSG